VKILYVDLEYDYGMKNRGPNEIGHKGFSQVFEKLGHQVVCLYYDDYLNRVSELQTLLLESAQTEKPDLIFFSLFGDQFYPETLLKLKEKYKTINWFGDDHWRFDSFTKKMAPCFTYAITTDPFALPKYKEIGFNNVILSQWAALNFENLDLAPIPYQYEVSFIGGSHSVRRWFVSELGKKGIKVDCFGYGWPAGPVSLSEMARIFKASKINLNLSNSINFDLRYLTHNIKNPVVALTSKKTAAQIKARNFEIPYFGGFQMTDYVPFLESYFEIGKEISCYRDFEEAALLINFYLKNESERESLRAAGTLRSRNQHSYLQRHKEIFEKIK
jgi:spore maturation protein CgeB